VNVIGPGVISKWKDGNAGKGAGQEGWDLLLSDAWSKAKAQGESFAEDCKCQCDRILVVFKCRGSDAVKFGGEYCGKVKPYVCKKNAKKAAK